MDPVTLEQPRQYTTLDPFVRFWAKVDKNGPIPAYARQLGPCWLWTGYRNEDGYGRFGNGERMVGAHRWAYEQEHGPIPYSLECDHLCRVRHCVRASHIEAVTHHENLMRGESPSARAARCTHCPQEHPYDQHNTMRTSDGKRRCRECHRAACRRWYEGRIMGHG